MKLQVRNWWTKALLSGEYDQTTGELACDLPLGGTSFCCLGVLVNIYCEKTGKDFDEVARDSDGVLPEDVMVWAGLGDSNPDMPNDLSLAEHNDDMGDDFPTIAKLIEENL